jgi:hypothetical protein
MLQVSAAANRTPLCQPLSDVYGYSVGADCLRQGALDVMSACEDLLWFFRPNLDAGSNLLELVTLCVTNTISICTNAYDLQPRTSMECWHSTMACPG